MTRGRRLVHDQWQFLRAWNGNFPKKVFGLLEVVADPRQSASQDWYHVKFHRNFKYAKQCGM